MTSTSTSERTALSTWITTGRGSFISNCSTVERTPLTPMLALSYITSLFCVIASMMAIWSSFCADIAWGLSTSTPVSLTNTVETIKKISRIKTTSSSGDMSMPFTSCDSRRRCKRLTMILPPSLLCVLRHC